MVIHPRLLANARQKRERQQQILLSERDSAVTYFESAMAGLDRFNQKLNVPWLVDLVKNLGKLREDLKAIDPTSPPSKGEVDLIVARTKLLQIAVNLAADMIRSDPKLTPQGRSDR